MVIKNNIAELLRKNNMTQRELAEKLKTTEVSVSRYVSGKRIPKAPVCIAMAKILNCEAEDLYYIEPEENKSAGMREFAKLHDELLEHEHDILSDVEMLSYLREKLYQNKDKNILKEIRPVLNAILHDTENYICWLESKGGI